MLERNFVLARLALGVLQGEEEFVPSGQCGRPECGVTIVRLNDKWVHLSDNWTHSGCRAASYVEGRGWNENLKRGVNALLPVKGSERQMPAVEIVDYIFGPGVVR